jgi:hypothetical protein
MRLTSAKVYAVHEAVKAATSTSWVQIGLDPSGTGSRYVLVKEPQQVVYGGEGAAKALSYLAGVATAYGVELSAPEVREVLDYLYESGRHNLTFDENGRDRASKVKAKA